MREGFDTVAQDTECGIVGEEPVIEGLLAEEETLSEALPYDGQAALRQCIAEATDPLDEVLTDGPDESSEVGPLLQQDSEKLEAQADAPLPSATSEGGSDKGGTPPPTLDGWCEPGDEDPSDDDGCSDLRAKQAAAARLATAFVATHNDTAQPDPAMLPSEETVETFADTVRQWAQAGHELAGREHWILGRVCLRSTILEPMPDEDIETESGVVLGLSIFDPEKPFDASPDEYYAITAFDTGDPEKTIGYYAEDEEAYTKPTDDEMRAFLDVAQAVVEADTLTQEDAEGQDVKIHPYIEKNTDYSAEDLRQFMEAHPDRFVWRSADYYAEPIFDPVRPEHWVRIANPKALAYAERPPTEEEVVQHLTDANEEHAKLAELGAIIPEYTHFILKRGNIGPLVCTVSKTVGDGQTLTLSGEIDPGVAQQHLRTVNILADYLVSAKERGRYLHDITIPGQWGQQGQLYDIEPGHATDLAGLSGELLGLLEWVRVLPPSPEREELWQRIHAERDELKRKPFSSR